MIKVYFEDNHLLVIEKPPGIVITKSETQSEETIEDILVRDFKINIDRGGIVHRLDKDTSGLLIVAKTMQSLDNLQAQFKDRLIKKKYLTLVHGSLEEGGRIEGAIERNPENREKFIVTNEVGEGKEAITEYLPKVSLKMSEETVKELYPDFNKIQLRKLVQLKYTEFTLVECFPLTGRTHQIRVHLKHIGFPIVGDNKYGGRKVTRLDHRWCDRQFLHAARIEFSHPENGQRLIFESELPEDLKKALDILNS